MSNNFDGQMGFSFFEDLSGLMQPVVSEPLKEDKKEEKKGAARTSSGAKVTGPVLCVGSGWTYEYGEEGKTYGAKVVAKALFDAGFSELAASGTLYTCKDNRNILIVKGISLSGNDDSEVIPKKVVVSTGLVKAEYEASDFDGKDADEVSVRDLTEKFVESYPDFAGCRLKLSRAAGACVPFFTKKAKIENDQAYRVWSTQEIVQVKGSELLSLYGSSEYDVEFFMSDTGVLFPSYSTKSMTSLSEADLGLKKGAAKKAVEKYPLPARLYIQALGESIEAEPSMFGGKEKVTSGEVVEFLKTRHRVFNQGDRKFDVIFDDESNTISVAILSGKKGAAFAAPFFIAKKFSLSMFFFLYRP